MDIGGQAEQGQAVTRTFHRRVYSRIDPAGDLAGAAAGLSVLITGATGKCDPGPSCMLQGGC